MDENPYESPQHAGSPASGPRRVVLAIVLGLLTIPAMAIAFVATCTATFYRTASDAALYAGGIGALVAGAGMIYLTVRAARPKT